MVIVLRLTSAGDIQKAANFLDRIHRKTPELTSKVMHKFGNLMVKNLKQAAMDRKDIKSFTGELFQGDGIRWEQRPRGKIGVLKIKQKYIYLDSMQPHWVAIKRSRTRLLAWAKQAQNAGLRKVANDVSSRKQNVGFVYVKPHPFIRTGWNRTRPRLRVMLHQEFRAMLRSQMR